MSTPNLNNSISKIIDGVNHFQTSIYAEKRELFHKLAKAQEPKILFITCSDSRIDAALLTQTEPGDMFSIQNAGNIVPPHGAAEGGVGASIEFAVSVLKVEHIIVCGHNSCGAMKALLHPENVETLPAIKRWLSFAEGTRALLKAENISHLKEEEQANCCTKLNIPVQLSHLRTLPSVTVRLTQNQVQLHGWVYDIESGQIEVYKEGENKFVSFAEAYAVPQAV